MPTAPLNVFQRLALTWDAVHPYNAAQACRVEGAFATSAVEAAWSRTLGELGLDLVQSESRGATNPVPNVSVHQLADDSDLSAHFTAELNRPFREGVESPFRPFLRREQHSTWLGVVYRHCVADSASIRELLRAWLTRISGAKVPCEPLALLPCRSREVLAGWRGDWRVWDTLLNLVRRYGDNRRVRKVHTMGPLDYPVSVRLSSASGAVLPGLLHYARSRGVKLNDVLLAALAIACDGLVPAQQRPGRDDLALSSIADLRPGLKPSLRHGFGCLLGFTTTVCRKRELHDWDRLLCAVAAQTKLQRIAGVGPASVLWMLAAEVAARYSPRDRVYDFYRKEIPLAAGLSNVNLNDTWAAGASVPRLLEYVRVSPTGPIVPLALAVTSLGDELQLALTYRTALFNDWTAAEIMQAFTRRLGRISGMV